MKQGWSSGSSRRQRVEALKISVPPRLIYFPERKYLKQVEEILLPVVRIESGCNRAGADK